MFELKSLSQGGLKAAQEKAVRYRLLNEPELAESICRDILAVDPDNQDAIVTLILALTDQFPTRRGPVVREANGLIERLDDDYSQRYYAGMICERRGLAQLTIRGPASGHIAYDWLRRAMEHYDAAEKIRPEGNDDAVLRWNTCARVIMRHEHVRPTPEEKFEPMLE